MSTATTVLNFTVFVKDKFEMKLIFDWSCQLGIFLAATNLSSITCFVFRCNDQETNFGVAGSIPALLCCCTHKQVSDFTTIHLFGGSW